MAARRPLAQKRTDNADTTVALSIFSPTPLKRRANNMRMTSSIGVPFSVARGSPPGGRRLDFLAQMNLV